MILEKLELGMLASNCYILGDESNKEGIIIDPGAEANKILSGVSNLGLDIKFIILTHGHIDHVSALTEVQKLTDAKVAIHANDAISFQENPLGQAFGSSLQNFPSPDILLKENDTIGIGKMNFRILHTPGHTPGGICLLGDGIVFTGDTLFNFGIGRTDFPGGSYDEELNSIRTKLLNLPDATPSYALAMDPTLPSGQNDELTPFCNAESTPKSQIILQILG